jgi:ABC-type sugar transport system ATPase subunit
MSGKAFRPRHPYDAIRKRIVLVPPDRLLALLPQRPVRENVAAPLYNSPLRWGPINMREEGRRVRGAVDAMQIDMRAGRQVRRLSGGNQQKVTIARWLASGFAALLCNDPTRGIDVGTKRQVYALLRDLANDGAAILFFSSELAEFPLVCDRVLTIYGGRVTAELPGVESDNLEISVFRDTLTLRGRREAEAADPRAYHRRERRQGQFSRTVTLPFRVDPDRVDDQLQQRVLRLMLHRPDEDKPRKIAIKA